MKMILSSTFLLTCLIVLHSFCYAQNVAVNNMSPGNGYKVQYQFDTNLALREALLKIKAMYQVDILFEESIVSGIEIDSDLIRYRMDNVEDMLAKVLKELNLRFKKIKKNSYVIIDAKKPESRGAKEIKSFSANTGLGRSFEQIVATESSKTTAGNYESIAAMIVTGTVTDENNKPLSGVNIMVKGTNRGVVSNSEGKFSIEVNNEKDVLVFSYVSAETQEITVGPRTNVLVVLKAASAVLQDVVVVGYGTQSQRNLTGSVASVKSEQIRQVPVMSPEQALQGRAAGVQVMQSNGAPGGVAQVQIRGVNSTNAGRNGPLYVLDGIPLFDGGGELSASAASNGTPERNLGSPIATLNPNDIETISVLKDASATAIYGARAANGVVVITTKSGRSGKTKVNVDYYYGVQSMAKKIDMQNAAEGMMIRNEALLNTISDFNRFVPAEQFNPYSFSSSSKFQNSNWQDILFRNAAIQDANVSFSGGTDKLRFLSSSNYFRQEGIFRNTYSQRLSTRLNLDSKISDRFNLGVRFTYANQTGNNVTDNNPFQGTILGALATEQWNQAFNPDGTYWGPLSNSGFWNGRNPVFEADKFIRPIDRKRTSITVFGEYEILKGLKFKSSFGLDNTNLSQRAIQYALARGPLFINSGPDLPSNNTSRASTTNANMTNWVWDQTLNYNKIFGGDHQVDVLLGYSVQQFTTKGIFIRGEGSLNPNLTLVGPNNGQNFIASESFSQGGIVSQFARVNYNYKSRYLLSGTVRRDGSSNFGPENQYGIFPAASIGWRISDENFMNNVSSVADIKLRASHGTVGNQDIGAFAFVPRVGASNYVFGATVVNGFSPGSLANTTLKWEDNQKTDFGIELSLMKGRVNLIAEYYINRAKGLLLPVSVPSFSGFGSITTNLGTIENKGYEFTLNTQNIKGSLNWNTSLNLSTLKNTVIDLGLTASGGAQEFFGYQPTGTTAPVNVTRKGLPIGSFIGWRTDGIFANYAETIGYPSQVGIFPMAGDVKYVDIDKNRIIDNNDREILGSPFPDFYGGFTNEFSYHNFSLNIFANFVVGNKIFNQSRLQREQFLNGAGGIVNLERWKPGSTNGNPRLTAGGQSQYNRLTSTRFLEDGSFFRIRNVTLAYEIPAKVLSRYKLQSLRLYTSGSNLLTFTKYKGWDPEINSSGSNVLSAGIDQTGYPVARTIQVGFNLGF